MTLPDSPLEQIKQPVKQLTSLLWFERLARLGYAAKGVVYFIVGLLAAQAAIGSGGKTTNTTGALKAIVVQPFGKFLLSILTLGIIGYVLWRLVQTFFDPEKSQQPINAKRIAKRIGYAISALAYTGLALTAVKLIIGSSIGDSESIEDWTIYLLAQPFGRWLVALAGVTVICVGIYYFYQAYKGKFRHSFKLSQMSQTEQNWAVGTGRFGIAARGVVFVIIGIFLMLASIQSNGRKARGLGGALTILVQQPFGSWILGVVASGLIAYGIYSVIQARYRHIANL
ncbi:DUF1206 domain-containing protein [Komarekiella sp. 'clone 1']|uniref:DUF1206 domain-containing protein n=1 Tax=Komarekiella delphini-convector SJRDD-AB1 TaxID=2593771 RepID=A0AA40VPS2_9NOST|nr:DUF1206 domain-containing protein [Komarekiella delphini-convector]MBD6614356.1 DUF1206 domain-containing protein [Komarekiella delphini-convector SJRDD-AB1]